MSINYPQLYAKKAKFKSQILKICPTAQPKSGIYIMTRFENNFKYAYVGQSVNVLERLVSHLEGFNQHIDKSIRKHGLYSADNPTGWKIGCLYFPESELNDKEQYYILLYANKGYQMRNTTGGSQGQGKFNISDNAPSKGYRDGIKQGRKNMAKEIKHILDTHCIIALKKETKVSQKALEKLNNLLNESEN